MKRFFLYLIALFSALTLLGSCAGVSPDIPNNEKATYSPSDLLYATEADQELAEVEGRTYYKKNDGWAVVAIVRVDSGSAGVVLVGRTPEAVSFYTSYNSHVIAEYTTFEYDGITWYCSINEYFMGSANFDEYVKEDIYFIEAADVETAGKEIIKIADTSGSTITISTVEDLQALANTNRIAVLAQDLDLSGVANWTPIENFTGSIDGKGYKITGLTLTDAGVAQSVGLFAELKGEVCNLTVEANISSFGVDARVGVIAATNSGIIRNVTVKGSVNAAYCTNVGGIVGYNNKGTLAKCTNEATVVGGENVGGVAGYLFFDKTTSCGENVNNGLITGTKNVGGVFGSLVAADTEISFSVATNNNVINGTDNVGGVFGYVCGYTSSYSKYNLDACSVLTNNGEVVAKGNYVGGVIGYAERLTAINTASNKADVSANGNYVGGIVGYAPNTEIFVNGANENSVSGNAYVGGIAGYAGVIRNAENKGNISSGAVIMEDSVLTAYVGGIAGYCKGLVNCKNTVDISVTHAGSYVGGLAGYMAILKADSFMSNINEGIISAKGSYVGGLVGYIKNADYIEYNLVNNENKGDVSGASYVGGIMGYIVTSNYYGSEASYKLNVLTNSAEISATGDYVGGIVGAIDASGVITASKNTASITGKNYVGGIIGKGDKTYINATGNENNSTITGYAYVGGFAGRVNSVESATNNGIIVSLGSVIEKNEAYAHVGGVAGFCYYASNCHNTADITVTSGRCVGGIAGSVWMTIKNSLTMESNVNDGVISGTDYVGGIFGFVATPQTEDASAGCSLQRMENNANVSGNNYVAGVIGYSKGYSRYGADVVTTLNLCKNLGEISGSSYVGGIVGSHDEYFNTSQDILETNTTISGSLIGTKNN